MKLQLSNFRIPYIARLLLFWLLFFAIYRVVFIAYHHDKIPQGHFGETLLSFIYALRLDVSTACAATLIPYVLWAIQQFSKSKFIHITNIALNITLIVLVSLLDIANLRLYGDWGTLLSARAFSFVSQPTEILHFITLFQLITLLFATAVFIGFGVIAYKKIAKSFSYTIQNIKSKIILIILMPALLVLGYRGGLQLTPINESSAYYSMFPVNNHFATNNIWYLAHSFVEANDAKNPYVFMDTKTAQDITSNLLKTKASQQSFLKTNHPNIVLIILESWTADIIKELGGEENVTPHFSELCKNGLLFTQMYGSGFRTEQGLVSLLSGFPAQPNNTIIATPSKAEKLPLLNVELEKLGYSSSFYYGGDVEFANMKSYLLNSHFQKIIDKQNFDKSQQNSKWGAHDEFVLQKQLTELNTQQQPFFSIALTLSTHEPFEVPMQTPFNGNEEQERFKKAAYYTDSCLYNYFNQAQSQAWYNNTLFILVADHGHHLPKNRSFNFPESRKITALITGGALQEKYRGTTYDKISSQHDIPATLLAGLNQPHQQFFWSKDMFAASDNEFAYYSNENALGWIAPQQNIIYFFGSKNADIQSKTQSTLNDTVLTQAQAYLQTLYEHYLNY